MLSSSTSINEEGYLIRYVILGEYGKFFMSRLLDIIWNTRKCVTYTSSRVANHPLLFRLKVFFICQLFWESRRLSAIRNGFIYKPWRNFAPRWSGKIRQFCSQVLPVTNAKQLSCEQSFFAGNQCDRARWYIVLYVRAFASFPICCGRLFYKLLIWPNVNVGTP